MDADESVARALEAPVELLPFLPELLADLDELGSDARQIAGIVCELPLPPAPRVVDLGCGKGAVAIAIASQLDAQVLGIDLFAPFVTHAAAAALEAGVAHRCQFRHGDARRLAATLPPADVVVLAALGDVLGDPAATMQVLRGYVRPGGFVIVADVFLRDGGSRACPGFESYRSRAETIALLTAGGDVLVREVVEDDSAGAADDGGDDDVAAIQRRAEALAARYPDHAGALLAFATAQANAHAHIAAHLTDAIWVLRRAGG